MFAGYKDIGTIGDAIGGTTAPIINGIGAILVYLAFKEQVNSTHQSRNLEISKMVNDRLNWLKNDPYKIVEIENSIKIGFGAKNIIEHPFNQATYLLLEFVDVYNLSQNNTEDKENLTKQTQCLYRIFYRDRMIEVQKGSILFDRFYSDDTKMMIVWDFMSAFREAEEKLGHQQPITV